MTTYHTNKNLTYDHIGTQWLTFHLATYYQILQLLLL